MDVGLPVLGAWSAVAVATTLNDGAYSKEGVLLATAAVAALGLSIVGRLGIESRDHRHWALVVAIGLIVYVAVYEPAGIYGSGPYLVLSRGLTAAAAACALLWLILRNQRDRAVCYLILATMTVAGVAMIVASPRPAIDVWFMLQAAAHSLSHGHDIYTARWTSGIPGEVANRFGYFPGTAVLLWPFNVLFGDVRYGLLAAMVGTSFLLTRAAPARAVSVLPCLILLYPKALFGLEQSWVDPLLLLMVCITAFLVATSRPSWAIMSFAAALACKPTAWLLVPIALIWKNFGWRRTVFGCSAAAIFMAPWFLATPHEFIRGVTYDVPRTDSLSLYAVLLRSGSHPGPVVTILAVVVAFVLVVWWPRLTTSGFLLGSAFVLAVFNLTSQEAFFNEWMLPAGVAVSALVFRLRETQDGEQDRIPQADVKRAQPTARSQTS